MTASHQSDGLGCGHGRLAAADGDDDDRRDRRGSATNNVTDLRRARQRARRVTRDLRDLIQQFLREQGIETITDRPEQQLNEAITRLAARTLREELLAWLDERRRTTQSRAARAAFSAMQRSFRESVPAEAFEGTPELTAADEALGEQLRAIDTGLLYDDDDALAEEVGNRVTRSLRTGFARDESMTDLARRVEYILTDGEGDDRESAGVTGQTISSKAEIIAHDSVEDAYITTATKRYLNNGFRYGIYTSTLDFKTSDLCRRMNGHVVDLIEMPILIPPNHPWCRSDIRLVLDIGDRTPLTEDDIADGYLKTIMSTNSFRPSVLDTDQEFRPTTLTEEFTPSSQR